MTDINTIKEIAEALKATETKPKPYDTTAEVIRVEDNTAWVHIPGGIDETPVQLSIDAKAGDSVNVRVSGGRAWITGNSSRPPTDDTVAHKANTTATEAQAVAEEAQETAEEASQIAQATKNYFWHDADGAHVSTVEGDASTGKNVLIDSDGMSIRNGTNELAAFEASKISLGKNSSESEIDFCQEMVKLNVEIEEEPTPDPAHSRLNIRTSLRALEEHDEVLPDEDKHTTILTLSAISSNESEYLPNSIGLSSSADTGETVTRIGGEKLYLGADTDSIYVRRDDANVLLEQIMMPIIPDTITTDLNDVTETGIYTYTSAASHVPNAAGGSLLVINRGSIYTSQLALPNSSQGTATAYLRLHYASGWGSWKSL